MQRTMQNNLKSRNLEDFCFPISNLTVKAQQFLRGMDNLFSKWCRDNYISTRKEIK